MFDTLRYIVQSMRPKQWIKNLIVLAPLAFVLGQYKHPMVLFGVLAFFGFCLASSGVYLLNDVLDREADKHHPEKKDRPIASGKLSVPAALSAMAVLFGMSAALALCVRPLLLLIFSGYVTLNLLYSFYLKKLVIIDAFSIAFGFILRILAGVEALRGVHPDIEISTWIILCTLLGSFFLAFCKRRHELSLEESSFNHRFILTEYSTGFLDQMIAISTAATITAYSLWTMWPDTVKKFETEALFWTVPFVCYGIFRYLYLVHQKNMGGSPSKVFLSDKPLMVNILLWLAALLLILYGRQVGGLLGFFQASGL